MPASCSPTARSSTPPRLPGTPITARWSALRACWPTEADPAFGGGDGVIVSDLPVNGGALDLALAPDGRIVLATGADGGGLLVARLQPDGEPDPSFRGWRRDGVGARCRRRPNCCRQAGRRRDRRRRRRADGGPRSALVSLRSDGEPDPDFGADGVLTTDFGSGRRSAVGELALQPTAAWSSAASWAAEDPSGRRPLYAGAEPDRSFSGDGVAARVPLRRLARGGGDPARRADRSPVGARSDLFVARLLPDGGPIDRSRGTAGCGPGSGATETPSHPWRYRQTARSWPRVSRRFGLQIDLLLAGDRPLSDRRRPSRR